MEILELQSTLSALWQQLGGNPANRAMVVARLLVNHADPTTKKIFTNLIECGTPPSPARTEALGLLFPQNVLSHIHAVSTPVTPRASSLKLRVEPEIGRLTVALHMAAVYRMWIVGRDLTRRATGSGKITKHDLLTEFDELGIVYTRRHFNRLLKQGAGLFWTVYQESIYLHSLPRVAKAVLGEAENRYIATDTNLPGVRDVYLDVSGSLEAWEARLYAGWIAYRGYTHDITISREAISRLFGRTQETVRHWESTRLQGVIQKQFNFAQCPDTERYFDYIPDHAQAYVTRIVHKGAVKDVVRLFWQLPNTYHALIEIHSHKGQAAKVRQAVKSESPASEKRGGNYRLYFTPEQLKRRFRSLKFRMGLAGDVNKPVYVFVGQHRYTHRRIFEITNSGFLFTSASERVQAVQERAFFAQQTTKFERLRRTKRNIA